MPRLAVVVAGIAAVAAGVAWWAVRQSEESYDDVTPVTTKPVVGTLDPTIARVIGHRDPWPFGDHLPEIVALRDFAAPPPEGEETNRRREKVASFWATKVEVHLRDASFADVVAALKPQVDEFGIPVFTIATSMDPAFKFQLDFDRKIELAKLIDEMRSQGGDYVRYFLTDDGLCIGTEGAILQAQTDALVGRARRTAARERDDPLLDAEFRPDFADAWMGSVVRLIREQTRVQVVTDAASWESGRKMTWRADPLPLRDALDRICESFGCVYRVRDGRVYILRP